MASVPIADAMAPDSAPIAARAKMGALERLPKWLNLVPMVAQWTWLALRYGSASLPSSANPAILGGGLAGEGKLDYFAVMGPHALSFVATATSFANTGAAGLPQALDAIAAAGLAFPIIAKPDIGWCGFGVRRIDAEQDLQNYLAEFPLGENIVLQRYLPEPGEAGIYYARQPGNACGHIIGILLRYFPSVTGDGTRTIAELIAENPRLAKLGADGLSEPCVDTSLVPAAGVAVRLTTIGSSRVGGLYRDGTALVTPALAAAIDGIAQDMREFHVGRFDVRFSSVEALQRGEDFAIIEVNGAGSEAVHAWDPAYTLRQSYGIVFAKQRLVFAIGHAMRQRGHRPIGLIALARAYLRQRSLIQRYPRSN